MAGSFTVDRTSIGTIIDTNCQIRSMTFVSPVSVVEPVAYDPVTKLPSSGTFCLADQGNYFNFNFNLDVLNLSAWYRNQVVPITPALPPSPKIIANLTCLSCPQGVEFTVVTA
jgi:hypothetical protein